jgi:macrolide-specific efflux system membrane fusion protein
VVNGLLGVLLVGGAGYGYASLNGSSGNSKVAGGVGTVQRGTLLQSVTATGSVASTNTQSLSFGASGTVTAIEAQVGARVHKGDVLARLDSTGAKENVSVAQAQLTAAQQAYAAATSTNSAQLYSSLVSARNSYQDAERTLAGTVITAPFSGTVIAVNGNVGGSSSGSSSGGSSGSGSGKSGGSGSGGGSGGSGGSGGNGGSGGSSGNGGNAGGNNSGSAGSSGSSGGFITLADPGHLQVTANFTEADTTKLKIGQTATVTFDALPGVSATGRVTSINSSSTTVNNVVEYGVTVAMDGPPPGVRLGQTSSVQVIVNKADGVLYVPATAVHTVGGVSTVIVKRADGRQVTTTVQIGLVGDEGTQIVSGLTQGEQVILSSGVSGGGLGGFGGRFGGGGLGGIGGFGGGLGGGGGARRGGGG